VDYQSHSITYKTKEGVPLAIRKILPSDMLPAWQLILHSRRQ
jgi:hypothetical protein